MKVIDLKSAPQHIPQLAQWHHQEWAHLSSADATVTTLIEQMSEYLTDAAIPKMFICEEANQVMGSSSLTAADMDTRTDLSPWLANVYVNAHYRNKGLGKLLVNAVVDYAKALGLQKIYLFTADKADFYQALGWSTISREDYMDEMVTIMEYEFNH
ncbi:GNAT family N-acetyltransferase [Shewanella sp. HN-41]|uniref:GNAT family N-acetyltransferase n=1 Tax=Shewanella sp. HN-41 TaxID=327275 RepID=UPI0002125CF7|nr:GNAT family N-acetyltransferase [Shewanella sp. HN-41]EGM68330.1 acetyltransferase, GNAT family [Shewanella sp. HN-41]